MIRHLLGIVFVLLVTSLSAQKPVEMKLWPNGTPDSNGITVPESKPRADRVANVSDPSLIVYPASKPNGLAVIACPGGGYAFLSMGQEGCDMAQWFNAQGITYAVLKYRMPNKGHCTVPLSDALQAIRMMRGYEDRWGIRKIGIMGASAGGHVASTVATHFTEDSRPDFQILLYPVISMKMGLTHQGSRLELLGETPSEELVDTYSNELHVTPNTPPAFILHCSDDKVVPVENSLSYYQALKKNGVSVTLHIYPRGGHGFGYYDTFHYKRQWTGEVEKWLREEINPDMIKVKK